MTNRETPRSWRGVRDRDIFLGVDRQAVLVVDDEPSIRLLCRINLELEGFDVLEAGTLAEARAAISSRDVSVVLLDLRIGHETGGDLVQELRDRQPHVAVAFVTGSAEITPTDHGLADAYLPKPFTIEALLTTVKRLAAR
jgi:DNA-binding NtrC family response regulator